MGMLVYVSNRKLCCDEDDFLNKIDLLAKSSPTAIMLREKDMSHTDYKSLAIMVKQRCDRYQVSLLINQHKSIAEELGIKNIHLSMSDLRKYTNQLKAFNYIGASVHSVSEAVEAQQLGASYLIAGHIYKTLSKKGIPPKGLSFLKEVCETLTIPVLAIGGMTREREQEVLKTGAKGICMMSGAFNTKYCHRPKNKELSNNISTWGISIV